ncbi:MAG: hypothetical protein NZ602_00180, partial [Thermoguttaceae bacterium]|nr:hypothetical protein [Thermoguttaceae bacterium]
TSFETISGRRPKSTKTEAKPPAWAKPSQITDNLSPEPDNLLARLLSFFLTAFSFGNYDEISFCSPNFLNPIVARN